LDEEEGCEQSEQAIGADGRNRAQVQQGRPDYYYYYYNMVGDNMQVLQPVAYESAPETAVGQSAPETAVGQSSELLN
jgi:hypothetical protein